VEGAAAGACGGFILGRGRTESPPVAIKSLHAKIGELTRGIDLLETALTKAALLGAKQNED